MGWFCTATSFFLSLYNLEMKKSKDGAIESCCNWTYFALLPVLVIGTYHVAKMLTGLWGFVAGLSRKVNFKKYGEWAVVTGATDGIGLGYCHALAKQGMNLVLVSRTKEKLETCAKDLKAKNPDIEVKIVVADFSQPEGLYERIKQELKTTEVGILINNVGMSYPHAEYMHLLTDDQIDNLIQLNVISTTEMTRIVLPEMVDRKKGCIINVSSAAGLIPIGDPLYAVYSATKAYVDYFSRSLHYELKGKGVHVQCQVPYFVTSKLSKIRKTSLTTPDPKTYAASALRSTGLGASVVPYPMHAIQHWVLGALPEFLLEKLVLMHHMGIRRRAYKKKEQKKNEAKTK